MQVFLQNNNEKFLFTISTNDWTHLLKPTTTHSLFKAFPFLYVVPCPKRPYCWFSCWLLYCVNRSPSWVLFYWDIQYELLLNSTLKVRMQMLHTSFLKTGTSLIKNEGVSLNFLPRAIITNNNRQWHYIRVWDRHYTQHQ